MDINLIRNIMFYSLIFVFFYTTIGFFIGLVIQEKYNISDNKAICISFFWPFIILFKLFMLLCKKIKQFIKLKETNKLEENKRKKELVDNVLKELNIR